MKFAVFIDDILKKECICLQSELIKEPSDVFEAESWEEAASRLNCTDDNSLIALICLPIHSAYITYVVNIDICAVTSGHYDIENYCDDNSIKLIYDHNGMRKKKMLNRELTSEGRIYDIVAGNLIVFPEDSSYGIERAYEIFGKGQVFIYDKENKEIKTIRCSPQALSVLRENNISIIV